MNLDAETYAILMPSPWWPEVAFELAYQHEHRLDDHRERDKSPKRLAVKRAYAAAHRKTKNKPGTPCPQCGTPVYRPRGWLRTFCNDSCRNRFHDRRRKEAARKTKTPATHCGSCGKALEQEPGLKPRKWCNEKCRRKGNRR